MHIDTKGFAMGDDVEDILSGAGGTIIGFTIWTTGCARAVIQAQANEDYAKTGKYPESFSCDVTMLKATGMPNRLAPVAPEAEAEVVDRSIGGPMPTPSRGR